MSKLDELMALADEYAADACGGADPTQFSARRRAALQSALKAVVEDAERYRWLRSEGARLGVIDWNALEWPFHDYEAMDAAIDAARKP